MNQIITALHYARSEAVLRQEPVKFCPSDNHIQCGGNWRNGQLVTAVSGKILQAYPGLPSSTHLFWKSSLGDNENIRWLPSGFTAGQSGSFYYCPRDLRYAKRIVILRSGRIRIDSDAVKSTCL